MPPPVQLPMFKASRDFIVLSLDGSCLVEQSFHEGQPATTPSILDTRPSTSLFNDMTLFSFAAGYCMPKERSAEPTQRRKDVIVVVRPYFPQIMMVLIMKIIAIKS